MQVMSVTGPVDEADLGRVLVHEHITIDMPGQELDPSYAPDIPEIIARSVDQLQKLRDLGVGAIVDPCPESRWVAIPNFTQLCPKSPA